MVDNPHKIVETVFDSPIYHETIITFVFTRDGRIVTKLKNDKSGNKVVIDNFVPWLFLGRNQILEFDPEKSVQSVSGLFFERTLKHYERVLEKALSSSSYTSDELYRKNFSKLGTIQDYGDYNPSCGERQFEIMALDEGTSFMQVFDENRESTEGEIDHIKYRFVLISNGLFPDPTDGKKHERLRYGEQGVEAYTVEELRSMPSFCSRNVHAIVFPQKGISPAIDFGINGELGKFIDEFVCVMRRFNQAEKETVGDTSEPVYKIRTKL